MRMRTSKHGGVEGHRRSMRVRDVNAQLIAQ